MQAAGGGLDTGVGEGVKVGVAVGGLAAKELVVVIAINSIAITIVGRAIFVPARSAFFTENITSPFEAESGRWENKSLQRLETFPELFYLFLIFGQFCQMEFRITQQLDH